MARPGYQSWETKRNIADVRDSNIAAKQADSQAKLMSAQAEFDKIGASREVGLAQARATNPSAFSKTPLLDKAMGINQTPTAGRGASDSSPAQWNTAPTTPNSGGASNGLAGLDINRSGNSYSAAPPPVGDYVPNPQVSYGGDQPSLGMPSSGFQSATDVAGMAGMFGDPTKVNGYADGGPVYGPEGLDQVPAEMPDGSPARLNNGEYVLPAEYVVGLAKKSLGKKAEMLPMEKLHALGVDLLDAEIAGMTGKAPGAEPSAPLPGQGADETVPGMAAGQGLPWDPYAQNNWTSEPPRDLRLPRNITPQSLAERQQGMGMARETASNVARTNNTIGAARAAGAQAPEFMRTLPPTNQMPVPYQGPYRIPRPPLPMAQPMQPPLAPYAGSQATAGSASYWGHGWTPPPTNQMPVEFVEPGRALGPARQGGALARNAPPQAQASGESWNPRGTAYARTDGGVEMGRNSQRGLVPRQAMATRPPPPVIEGEFSPVLPRGSASTPAGFFMDLNGPDRTVEVGGAQITVPNDLFGMRAMANQPITDPATGLGNMVRGVRDTVAARVGGAYDAWNARRPEQAPASNDGMLAQWNARRPGKQASKPGKSAAPAAQAPAQSPANPPTSNTQGYAERTKATLEADQRKRGEAYAKSTGWQYKPVSGAGDPAYMAGLQKAFEQRVPGQNYAEQINPRRQQSGMQQPRQPDPMAMFHQMVREQGMAAGLGPKESYQYIAPQIWNMMKAQQPDPQMARLQYDQSRAPVEDQQWVMERQQRAAEQQQALQIAQMNALYGVRPMKTGMTVGGDGSEQYQYAMPPWYEQMYGGQGGNMGAGPQIVDRYRGAQ